MERRTWTNLRDKRLVSSQEETDPDDRQRHATVPRHPLRDVQEHDDKRIAAVGKPEIENFSNVLY
jgi:hypothetical protein